jgi:hypothetical protein
MASNIRNFDGDTDQVMQDFSRARELLSDWFEPGGAREEFKIDQLAVLSVRYNLCREAEMDPKQSELRPSRRRLRTAIVDEIHTMAQLRRYRKLIQEEFGRVMESFLCIKAERLLTEDKIAKQTQFRTTASSTTGSGRSQSSNLGLDFGGLSQRAQPQDEL